MQLVQCGLGYVYTPTNIDMLKDVYSIIQTVNMLKSGVQHTEHHSTPQFNEITIIRTPPFTFDLLFTTVKKMF